MLFFIHIEHADDGFVGTLVHLLSNKSKVVLTICLLHTHKCISGILAPSRWCSWGLRTITIRYASYA